MLEAIRTKNLGSLLMKLSQSNFNLRLPDYYSVGSYLIATVPKKPFGTWQFDKSSVLINFIIQDLKFFNTAQLFFVSFSHGSKSEGIERK